MCILNPYHLSGPPTKSHIERGKVFVDMAVSIGLEKKQFMRDINEGKYFLINTLYQLKISWTGMN